MGKVFEIASSVSTPLAVSGFLAAVFFFVVKQILAKNIFPSLSRQLSSEIIKLIIDRLFVLSLVALVLGFLGYILPRPKAASSLAPFTSVDLSGEWVSHLPPSGVLGVGEQLSFTFKTQGDTLLVEVESEIPGIHHSIDGAAGKIEGNNISFHISRIHHDSRVITGPGGFRSEPIQEPYTISYYGTVANNKIDFFRYYSSGGSPDKFTAKRREMITDERH